MAFAKLGSGDNQNILQLSENDEESTKLLTNSLKDDEVPNHTRLEELNDDQILDISNDHDNTLRNRITQCRSVIEALKHELYLEKCRVENGKANQSCSKRDSSKYSADCELMSSADGLIGDKMFSCNEYSACVDSKLNCDENFVEYEKQLQKYQNTLNMAQIEKKNAIRKQMLYKAYRLKLLEVENQCNIELLRVKQSMQCLEPLKVIANRWKSNTDELYDMNNFDLLPRYPDIYSQCSSDIGSNTDLQVNTVIETPAMFLKNDSSLSDAQ